MKSIKKITAVLLAFSCAGILVACASSKEGQATENAENIVIVSDVKTDDASSDNDGQAAQETVTVKADATGAPISAKIKRSNDDMEEEVDINDIPFAVHISYFLDDQEISPKELAGASGRLRIRFDYENRSESTVKLNGRNRKIIVPFAFVSMVSLEKSRFSDIKVTNGKLTTISDTNVVYGYAMPGIKDALGLDAVKDKLRSVGEKLDDDDTSRAEDEDDDDLFPDFVEITADTENCKIEFTATIVTNGFFSDSKEKDINDIEDIIADFGEFGDVGDELADGIGELGSGAWELGEGLDSYVNGAGTLADGAAALSEGASALAGQNEALTGGAEQLATSLAAVSEAMQQLEAAMGGAVPEIGQLSASLSALTEGATELSSGIKSYTDGVTQISDGASQLADGASALSSVGSELNSGFWKMIDGITELQGGVDEMNDKMFRNIASLSEGELPEMVDNYRLLCEADRGFTAWNTYDGKEGSIRFILETEEIGQ